MIEEKVVRIQKNKERKITDIIVLKSEKLEWKHKEELAGGKPTSSSIIQTKDEIAINGSIPL